jgi:hypothetical protein
MLSHRRIAGAVVLLWALQPARAQNSTWEFWPEYDVYVQQSERLRLVFQNVFTLAPETGSDKASFTGYIELALRPLLRVELRNRNDVFRRRFLTFRAGYRYVRNFEGQSGFEHRAIAELRARYVLPAKLVLYDRSRGEFRFIHGQPFSSRYRNRLGLERDMMLGPVKVTPEAYCEVFYDTRYDAWSTVRYAAGAQLPAGRRVVFEPYLVWQVAKQPSHRDTAALGFKIHLFF